MSKEIPDQCKYIKTCAKPVTEGTFKYLCQTADWINCDWVNLEDYKEFLLSPAERLKKAEKPGLRERNESNDKDSAELREDLASFAEDLKEE